MTNQQILSEFKRDLHTSKEEGMGADKFLKFIERRKDMTTIRDIIYDAITRGVLLGLDAEVTPQNIEEKKKEAADELVDNLKDQIVG